MKYKRARFIISYAFCLLLCLLFAGCGRGQNGSTAPFSGAVFEGTEENLYAGSFRIDDYEGGYKFITLSDGSRFLLTPEGKDAPRGIAPDVTPLSVPLNNVYLAATAAASLIDRLSALSCISFSGTRADGWYNENMRALMEKGEVLYAGKYSAPDYELLVSRGCTLAIESMMIGHASEVKQKLENSGVPVICDRSSEEDHPLGRVEWIKVYAALFGKEEEAARFMEEQAALLSDACAGGDTGKTVAFFYVTSAGKIVARKSNDYITRMIELAGGHYVFKDLDTGNSSSSLTLDPEAFYESARDADVLIYNSSIDKEVDTLSDLLKKNELLADFKAVKTGDVWCTGKNVYQETASLCTLMKSFSLAFCDDGTTDELPFLKRLK